MGGMEKKIDRRRGNGRRVGKTIGRKGGRGCGHVRKLGQRKEKSGGDEERQWGDEQIHTRQVRGGEGVRGRK